MPILTGPKEKVWVPVGTIKYGYLMDSNSFSSFGATLGIKTAAAETKVFYGCNSPKPPRATLKTDSGSQSSYYDIAKAKSLASAGWKLSGASRRKAIKSSGTAITVCVDTPYGAKYAWNIPAGRKAATLALGAEEPTDPNVLVWGAFPKPPRATKRDATGISFSTFCPPDQTSIDAAVELGYNVEGLDGDWLNV